MKIALIGYGKMGKAIEKVAIANGHEILLKITSTNKEAFNSENLSKCDVAIEFTNPHSAVENLIQCFEAGIPVICGSTGWLEELNRVKQICNSNDGAFVYASNYSIGVNLFFELNTYLAKLMSQYPTYNVQLEEIHHTEKKDAPSGTAITLAEQILDNQDNKKQWVNHLSNSSEDLEIISKRIDPAPGTHKIKYASLIDDIEIIHTAHNREGFAKGAVLAAEFIIGKKGYFGMKEVLGLNKLT